LLLPPAAALA